MEIDENTTLKTFAGELENDIDIEKVFFFGNAFVFITKNKQNDIRNILIS